MFWLGFIAGVITTIATAVYISWYVTRNIKKFA